MTDTGQVRDDDPGEPSTGKPRVSVTEQEAAILTALAHGRCVLEIGTGLGVSTRALAASAQCVVTHDVDEWVHNTIWPALPGNVTPAADRADITRSTTTIPPAFNLVFIDADHRTKAVCEDLKYARSLNPELIVCHDANYANVRDGLDGNWHIIPTVHGLALQWQ